jgi:hypothetical protein
MKIGIPIYHDVWMDNGVKEEGIRRRRMQIEVHI